MTWTAPIAGVAARGRPSTEDFIESVKQDIFRDQVFIYTPEGCASWSWAPAPRRWTSPTRSTPNWDTAASGGKVNGQTGKSLDTALQNGDTVEIMSNQVQPGSQSWTGSTPTWATSSRPAPARSHAPVVQPPGKRGRPTSERGREKLRKRDCAALNQNLDDSPKSCPWSSTTAWRTSC